MSKQHSSHGGNIRQYAAKCDCEPEEILDFSANINPLGFPPWTRRLVARTLEYVVHYPDAGCESFINAVAEHFGVSSETVVAGNGSSDILYKLPSVLDVQRAVIPVPAYVDYAAAAEQHGLPVERVPLAESSDFAIDWQHLTEMLAAKDLVFLGQPNNPTGQMFDPETFATVAQQHPDTYFVVDESFAEFVEQYQSLVRSSLPNVIVLRSMTKFYGVPGMRVGFAVAPASVAGELRKLAVPWSVNTFAQTFAPAALADTDYGERTRRNIAEWREKLFHQLSQLSGIHVFPGEANFLLCKVTRTDMDAEKLAEQLLLQHKIPIRVCANFDNLDEQYFRIAVRTEEENERLYAALAQVLAPEAKASCGERKKTPALMVQGTSSNAGKSILCAGLCRVMLQDGFNVAPFKAQNMSLNSYVTRDGGEMGRAQVVQAQACRLDPEVRMNPILLKPSSDTGSQVILRGKPVANMDVTTYVQYKEDVRRTVYDCYDALSSEYDAVVMEGAGSPGEVNLKADDLVNMKMAHYADAPVILTGDIDRGGVYASFIGTMEVLEEWERRLVQGFLVNRFRGDPSLLTSAHMYVKEHTGRDVIGVIPYLKDLGLPEEDSVEFKNGRDLTAGNEYAAVTVAVIDLPHISNFTDIDPFLLEPDVEVRVVRTPAQLGTPDAVIIPGSKNTIGDLKALYNSGMADALCSLVQQFPSEVVGICGGFQMLGKTVSDPYRIESDEASCTGLDLLNVETRLAREKTLRRAEAHHFRSGSLITGYEIHHGETICGEGTEIIAQQEDDVCGVATEDGQVWGTYLHGTFDNDEFRRWFINELRKKRGVPASTEGASYSIEPALDRLADVLRENIDIPWLYEQMGLRA